MTAPETAFGAAPPMPGKPPLSILLHWVRNNPILHKEMRGRMRGARSMIGITAFTALLGMVILVIYGTMTSISGPLQLDALRTLGRTIFFTVYGLELIVVCVVTPAQTAGTISHEKEQQTYDLLRTTLLSARDLVLGKLLAALSYILLLIFAALPLQSIALIFGGLTASEIIISQMILILTALAFGSMGIYFSSWITKTRIATGAAQFTSLSIVALIPILLVYLVFFTETRFTLSSQSDLVQVLFFGVVWLVAITNPVITAIFTEVFLAESQALYFYSQTLNSGTTFLIPSPWLGFGLVYPVLIFTLLFFAIRNVQKTAFS